MRRRLTPEQAKALKEARWEDELMDDAGYAEPSRDEGWRYFSSLTGISESA